MPFTALCVLAPIAGSVGQYLDGYRPGLTIRHGATVLFACGGGAMGSGPRTALRAVRCLFGVMQPAIPFCGTTPPLPFLIPFSGDGVPDDSSYTNGDLLLISGTHRGDPRGCAAPARVQGSLVYINGHVMREGEARASFPDETEVTFNCMSSIMGERSTWRIVCRDGSWVGESNSCDAEAFVEGIGYHDNNTCTYRNSEPNVVSFYNDTLIKEDYVKFPEGSEVVSRCRDIGKFALIGSSQRKCINGEWDGQKPVCFGLNQQNDYALEKPPTILFRHSAGPIAQSNDGKLIVYPGTVLHMECLWIRRFGPPKWTVSHNFRVYPTGWSTEEGRDSTLEFRLTIMHASKDDSGTFSCTTPTRHTHSIQIQVKSVHCPELPQKRGITYSTTSTKMNSRVTISCANGNSLIGATELVCLPSGNWSTNVPVCESVECADISNNNTSNLRVSILSREVGGQAVFSCPSGYGLRGNANTMCQPTGEWAGPFPTCEEVHCEAPGIPENGMIQGTAPYKAGDVVQFSCNQQYMLEGQPIIACQENGRWSGSVPKCVLACTYPGTVFHGHISAVRFYYKIGENITFECDEGLVIKGASMLRCQRSGQWSNALPVCVKISELDANDELDESEGDDTEKHER